MQSDNDKTAKIPVEQALEFLEQHFDDLKSVGEWGEAMGYTRSAFWKSFDRHYRYSPRQAYIDQKKKVLCTWLKSNGDTSGREAAIKIHLGDGDALYKFVKRHFNCSVSTLRDEMTCGADHFR
jgi:methylphosphotriester-DNA--protein-cysteine methyltransferase